MMKQVVFILLWLTITADSYNFLVFCPLFGHSHTTFFAKIADILTDAGHNVTFFTPTILSVHENVTYVKSTKHVVKLSASKELNDLSGIFDTFDMNKFWNTDSSLFELLPTVHMFQKMHQLQSEWMFENIEVLEKLKKSYKYDAIIYEPFIYQAYPLMDYLGIKTQIPATSLTQDTVTARAMGETVMPSEVVDVMCPFDQNMTLLQRIINAISSPIFHAYMGIPTFLSFTKPRKPIDILSRIPKSSFLLVNSNPYLDFPRPTITKTVQVGGISVDLGKTKLTEEIDEILNLLSKNMLISFGSVQQSQFMPNSYKVAIIAALSKFPDVTFIWKYESENHSQFNRNLSNVHFMKWVPQRAMLTDPRLTAFFTHAGLGSVNELNRVNMDFSEAIRKVLNDSKFEKNARNLARRLEKQPIKPSDMLVKHCEFAAEFGELPSLDPYSRQMSFVTYFMDRSCLTAGLQFGEKPTAEHTSNSIGRCKKSWKKCEASTSKEPLNVCISMHSLLATYVVGKNQVWLRTCHIGMLLMKLVIQHHRPRNSSHRQLRRSIDKLMEMKFYRCVRLRSKIDMNLLAQSTSKKHHFSMSRSSQILLVFDDCANSATILRNS